MSQSLANVSIHSIFSTKQRQAFIDELIQPELYAYITTLAVSYGSFVHCIGGIDDHVHLLANLPRTVSISELLEGIKKNSSKWMKTKGVKYQSFAWQKGFGVFSVSESCNDAVIKYIRNQKEHHKKHTFQDEFRRFLKLNKIPYDEKYLWD